MTITHTFTRTHTVTVPANPYLRCNVCQARVEGFVNGPAGDLLTLVPCGHRDSYYDVCPSWGPVDGCRCEKGNRPHGDPPAPVTEHGALQGPL